MTDAVPVLLGVAAIWVVAVASPGPAFLVVVDTALRQGRRAALRTVAGLSCGTLAWGVAGFFGVALLFSSVPWAYVGLKAAGGVYLIYLGLRAWLGDPPHREAVGASATGGGAWRRGALTNLTNPKAAAFVAGVYATTMPPDPSPALGAAAIATMVSITATGYSLVAVLLTTRRAAKAYRRARHWIERIAGTCLIAFGARMIADR